MTGMVIDYTWTILFVAMALLSLRFSWRSMVRPIAWALLGSIAFSTTAMMMIPADMIEMEPAVFAVAEIGVMIVAVFCLHSAPRHAAVIMMLNLLSCIVSLAYPVHDLIHDPREYEAIVNTIFGIECVIQLNVGLWNYAGDRMGRYFRLRRHRRNAVHALLRFRMAAETRDQDRN